MKIAITADLHWGTRHTAGDRATEQLVQRLRAEPPDVLVLAGDVGAGEDFAGCLALFDGLPCRKALLPGNHDVWVRSDDPRGDSLAVYESHLPAACKEFGFEYLDAGPVVFPDDDVAIVGTMNWYDYSWSLDALKEASPEEWEWRLAQKRFTRGRHNDANFVRWRYDDGGFTRRVVETFAGHLDAALEEVSRAIVVTHHPPFRELNYPRSGPATLDGLLWEAFSGNARMEGVLRERADRIPLAFCGHTHAAREGTFAGIRGHNIGGDYHFKRLLWADWPEGAVVAEEFRG